MATRHHLHEEGTEEVKPTRAEAARIALDEAKRAWGHLPQTEELVILDEWTFESPIAWAFVYNTRSYVESGDIMKGLVGNGPVIVFKANGEVQVMGSGFSAETALKEIAGE